MIKEKKELLYYLACDKIALKIPANKKRPPILKGAHDLIWAYEIILRKLEYYENTRKCFFCRLIYKYLFSRLGLKLGFSIPINTFGPGLSLAHPGTIIVNASAKVGANCRVQTGVTLGATNGSNNAPKIGNNVFLGEGAKIIGDIEIADGVSVGANAVVVKSITEPNTTWGGVPAKKISNNSSASNVVCATEIYEKTIDKKHRG